MPADLFLSSHLDIILKKLASSSLREFGVVRGLETELKNLESTLGTIQTVIVDAEAAQQLTSEEPSSWLLELKDLLYDSEDVVAELLIEAAYRERHSRGRLGYQLEILPDGLFQNLKALNSLSIQYCPSLRSMPDGLQGQKNLRDLRIGECPNLESRCKKESGKDWQKIAHISSIWIRGEHVQSLDD